MGGQNPQEVGMGVQVASIDRRMVKGPLKATGRQFDFAIDDMNCNHFFSFKNSAGMMVYSRLGRLHVDGHNSLVDANGNRALGFMCNVESAKGEKLTDYATEITLPVGGMSATSTTEVEFQGTVLPSKRPESVANINTNAYELFSGGEAFGDLSVAASTVSHSQRVTYGAYTDSVCYKATAATTVMATGTGVITLGATDAPLAGTGFQLGDQVLVRQTSAGGVTTAYTTFVTAVTAATDLTVNTSSIPVGWTNGGTVEVINLSRKTSNMGSNNLVPGAFHDDVLHNQVALIDGNGNLVASFHRVSGEAKGYTHATAMQVNATQTIIATGEFNSYLRLGELIQTALKDSTLSYNGTPDTAAEVTVDKFGKISVDGTGTLTNSFRLVVNQDNTEFRQTMGSLLYTGAASGTQAVLNSSGQISNPVALGLTARTAHTTNSWYDYTSKNYGFNSNAPGTAYGEFAGLRLSSSNNSSFYGQVQLSLVNGLGQTVTRTFSCVPRQADPEQYQFQTLGDLAEQINSTLRTANFSSIVDASSALESDASAQCQISSDGRIVVSTSSGSFNNLVIKPLSTSGATADMVNRPDSMNFGAVLGALSTGINGAGGTSNKIIRCSDVDSVGVFDNKGQSHQVRTYFIQDLTSDMSSIEWKFKIGLDANCGEILNGISAANTSDYRDIYVDTYNNVADSANNRGVLGFDMITNKLYTSGQNGDPRYKNIGNIQFQYKDSSIHSDKLNVSLDFSKAMTAHKEGAILSSKRKDGNKAGELIGYSTEDNGEIKALYTNGEQRTCARLGLMAFSNPEGLRRTGSSCYQATSNSDLDVSKDVAQIFCIDPLDVKDGKSSPKILAGNLEDSNVDMVKEMSNAMELSQFYTLGLSMLRKENELMETTISALS
jgi:flagellar hook-basal body protein